MFLRLAGGDVRIMRLASLALTCVVFGLVGLAAARRRDAVMLGG